ncbi:MAG TPA: hypothetical protein VF280_01215 [Burkholderiales bacterium]
MAGISELRMREEAIELADTALAIGFRRIAREHFKRQPPSALEVEGAIAAIEDEIARVKPPRGTRLVTRDAVVREIALAAGVPPGPAMVLAREAVEQAFERALRRPPDNERMAALLILRELVHHLDIECVEVQGS